MSAKSFCGQCVTKWYDLLQATYSSLEAWSRNDCKWFIQNPCLKILQVIHLRPLGHQEPCGKERLLPKKSYQRPKFQPKLWSLVCNVSKPLLSLCFRSLNLQNVVWAPWPLWCLPISFLVAQTVKKFPTMQETWIRALGQEDALEKGIATHSSILDGEFHGQRSLAGYSPWGCKESDTTEQLKLTNIPFSM